MVTITTEQRTPKTVSELMSVGSQIMARLEHLAESNDMEKIVDTMEGQLKERTGLGWEEGSAGYVLDWVHALYPELNTKPDLMVSFGQERYRDALIFSISIAEEGSFTSRLVKFPVPLPSIFQNFDDAVALAVQS